MQIPHRGRETFMSHHFSDQPRISGLGHGHRAERVPGTIQLQFVRNAEPTSQFPEPVFEPTQLDVAGRSFLRRKDPSFSCPRIWWPRRLLRLLALDRSEQGDDALAQ